MSVFSHLNSWYLPSLVGGVAIQRFADLILQASYAPLHLIKDCKPGGQLLTVTHVFGLSVLKAIFKEAACHQIARNFQIMYFQEHHLNGCVSLFDIRVGSQIFERKIISLGHGQFLSSKWFSLKLISEEFIKLLIPQANLSLKAAGGNDVR